MGTDKKKATPPPNKGFQFPTNGKAHGNSYGPSSMRWQRSRFNSLQTGKHMGTLTIRSRRTGFFSFQFPTNGKAHGNNRSKTLRVPLTRTDLFQFPTNGKAHGNNRERDRKVETDNSFNSLQTGKHMGTNFLLILLGFVMGVSIPYKRESTWEQTVGSRFDQGIKFQFPTNGKAHGNLKIIGETYVSQFCVSIPYKRESTWEPKGLRTCKLT